MHRVGWGGGGWGAERKSERWGPGHNDLPQAPDAETLERFLGRLPLIFKIVIISPHGYFGQVNRSALSSEVLSCWIRAPETHVLCPALLPADKRTGNA